MGAIRVRIYFIVLAGICICCNSNAQNKPRQEFFHLSGTATGGSFIIAPVQFSLDSRVIEFSTSPGESASSVLSKIVGAGGTFFESVNESTIAVPGRYYIAGTECGLNLTPAPEFLSAVLSEDGTKIKLSWVNPTNGYDDIIIRRNGPLDKIPGDATNYEDLLIGQTSVADLFLAYTVQGVRNNTPSNLALLFLDLSGNCMQTEVGDAAFSCGIANNWRKWDASTSGSIQLSEGRREIVQGARVAENKSRYQLVGGEGSDFKGGAYREFLGLTAGHEYKVMFRILNLGLLDKDDTWAFSLHATSNAATGDSLTSAQLAGAEPLPDGSFGVNAGQIARFSGTSGGELEETSDEMWVSYSTEDSTPSRKIGNIILPADATKITIWFRYEGSGEVTGNPAIEWIGLEDKSCQQ